MGVYTHWANRTVELVRDALLKSDPYVRKALERHPDSVWSSYEDPREWSKSDPFGVIVGTESGIGDPYEYDDVYEAFDKAIQTLLKNPFIEDAGWESINPAVHLFWIEPRLLA